MKHGTRKVHMGDEGHTKNVNTEPPHGIDIKLAGWEFRSDNAIIRTVTPTSFYNNKPQIITISVPDP